MTNRSHLPESGLMWLLRASFPLLSFVMHCGLTGCVGMPKITTQEERLMIRAFRDDAASFHQASVHLLAPDILVELQGLTNEIAAANDVKKRFCVYLTYNGNPEIRSHVTGEIFVPSNFIEMVDNRDEMAFGLAREIAYQGLLIPLKHYKAQYIAMDRARKTRTISSLLIASAVGSLWGTFVQGPLHQKIMAELPQPPDPYLEIVRLKDMASTRWSVRHNRSRGTIVRVPLDPNFGDRLQHTAGSLARAHRLRPLLGGTNPMNDLERQNRLVGDLLNRSIGWIPNLITQGATDAVVRIVNMTRLNVDPRFRVEKDALGLYFMSAAGYNPDAAMEVIRKRVQFEESLESQEE